MRIDLRSNLGSQEQQKGKLTKVLVKNVLGRCLSHRGLGITPRNPDRLEDRRSVDIIRVISWVFLATGSDSESDRKFN